MGVENSRRNCTRRLGREPTLPVHVLAPETQNTSRGRASSPQGASITPHLKTSHGRRTTGRDLSWTQTQAQQHRCSGNATPCENHRALRPDWTHRGTEGQRDTPARHINRPKKDPRSVSTHAGKAFNKLQHPFMMKNLSKIRTEGNCIHLLKNTHKIPTNSHHLRDEKVEAFPVRSGIRPQCPSHHQLLAVYRTYQLLTLARAIRQEK